MMDMDRKIERQERERGRQRQGARGSSSAFMRAGRYLRDKSAATAAMFAIMLPVLIGSIGMAVDISRAYLVQARLSHALDAAALAAAASASGYEDILAKLQQFFDANYPPEKIGVTYNLHLEVNGDDVSASADADYNTTFLRVLGINNITVKAATTVQRQIKGIEVAMVLDVTGSMSTNNNIGALRDATSRFLEIMYARDASGDPSPTRTPFVKVGIVPFATSVNVGPYGLGKNPDGSSYDTAFVSNPKNIAFEPYEHYTTSATQYLGWRGCILENSYPSDTTDHEGPWKMYRWCRNSSDSAVCDTDSKGKPKNNPNNSCPRAYIQPLTNDLDKLDLEVSRLQANGNTLGNIGMVWGYRVISPEYPFTEGADWDDKEWRKAVIIMTDGENTQNTTYSGYGVNSSVTPSQMNSRFEEVCTELKDKGVTVYTIIFTSGIPTSTKRMFERCATTPDKYHYAPEQSDLYEVFESIARELSNLHIKG